MIIGRRFEGSIDDVRFYDGKISSGIINQLYALQSSCAPTSIPEQQIPGINLYPNPVRQDLTLATSLPLHGARIIVYNMLGQVITQQELDGNLITTLSLSDKAPGTYIVKVQDGSKVLSTKIIQKL